MIDWGKKLDHLDSSMLSYLPTAAVDALRAIAEELREINSNARGENLPIGGLIVPHLHGNCIRKGLKPGTLHWNDGSCCKDKGVSA